MSDMKRCPHCAEEIRAEATRCRYCRSRLISMDPSRWHRNHEDARLGGVCAAVSAALAVPVSVVRLAMILFTIFLHIGPVVYFGLWLIIPPRPGEDSQLERLMRWGLELAEKSSGRRGGPPWRNEY